MDRVDAWLARCPDPAHDPLEGMAETGLLAPAASYAGIARIKAALTERTGLLGVGGVWGGRQMVGRWFIDGFGTTEQKSAWLGRTAAVSISEPKAGAHPKHLTTWAIRTDDGWRISGEKAWCSNGPIADVLIVLAIVDEQDGRKRFGMFLVPRGSKGLSLTDMPGFHALRPSRHCAVTLDNCLVPDTARLGLDGDAYTRMALPFRDVEDIVGTFGLLGAFRFVLNRLRPSGEASEQQALSLGALVALTAVYETAAEAAVARLDQGNVESGSPTLVGLRLLGANIGIAIRDHITTYGCSDDQTVAELLRDMDALSNVARGPRLARQARLGR